MYRVLTREEVEILHKIMNPELARIEKEEKAEQERKAYKFIIFNLLNSSDSYIESNYKYENIKERFGKSLEDFKNDIFEEWKNKERAVDDYDDEEEYAYGEDEDEEIYW